MRRLSASIRVVGLGVVLVLGGCNKKAVQEEEYEAIGGSDGSDSVGGSDSLGGKSQSGNRSGTTTNAGGKTSSGSAAGGKSSSGSGVNVTSVGGSSSSGTVGGSSSGGSGSSSRGSVGGTSSGGTSPSGSNSSSRGGSSSAATGGSGATTSGGATTKGGTSGSVTSSVGGSSVGGSSATSAAPSRGPTPATSSAKFPFPQNRQKSNCIYPTDYLNEDVQAVYEAWKKDLVTSDGAGGFRRVKRPSEPGLEVNSTVSEGIAYGMMIAVYMNDQALFDDLWKYSLAHAWTYTPPGGGGGKQTLLMNWYIAANGNLGSNPSGSGAATDADEDMAWALIMADRQWGGQGSLSKSYLEYAKQMLSDIWTYEILDGKLPKNGSGWGDWKNLNISYFAPAYYRVFASVSGNAAWGTDVVKCVYDTIESNLTAANGNQTNGLVPAFSTSTGEQAVVGPGQSQQRHDYQYDSCRTPFRIGLDACLFKDSRANSYLDKISQFFAGIGAANIKDGYTLSGSPTPEWGSRGFGGLSAAFIGPAGVGAMHASSYQSFVDDAWNLVRKNNMWCGGQYYDESWTMLTMLMMSGNFLDYTAETPK